MKIAHVTAINEPGEGFPVDIVAGRHELLADEHLAVGGTDAGPNPFGLMLSGLAACTLITLRMYAQRKHWPLERVRVVLDMTEDDGEQHIERRLLLEGHLDDGQRARLLDIAEKTPVTKTLKRALSISTHLRG